MTIDTTIGITGFVTSLVFGALSLVFYFKAKSVRLPSFVFDHVLMQTRAHPDVTISFRGQKIENLSRSRILFYNKGKMEIRAQDKPKSGFPKVVFPEGTRILSAIVTAASSSDIAFRVEKQTDTALELGYEYLNRNDGGIVEVLFEGTVSTKSPIEFRAALIGAEPARSYAHVAKPKSDELVTWIILFSTLGLVCLSILSGFAQSVSKGNIEWKQLAIGTTGLVMVSLGVWVNLVDPYRKAVPAWARAHFDTRKRKLARS